MSYVCKKYASSEVFKDRDEVTSWINYNLDKIEFGEITIISITDCLVGLEREFTVFYMEKEA